jgi:hypothetical protein
MILKLASGKNSLVINRSFQDTISETAIVYLFLIQQG